MKPVCRIEDRATSPSSARYSPHAPETGPLSVRPARGWSALVCLAGLLLFCHGEIRGGEADSSAITSPRAPGKPAVVARVDYPDRETLAAMAARLDIWEAPPNQGYVVAALVPEEVEALRQAGHRLEVLPKLTALLHQGHAKDLNQLSGIPGYPCYRTVDETLADMARLTAAYPSLVRWADIGDSWDKVKSGGAAGDDLIVLVLSNHERATEPKFRFFLMAEIHARELVTTELAMRWAEGLLAAYGGDPDATWLLDHGELHLLPLANPDGRRFAEQGYLWRKNTNNGDGCTTFPNYGTDLNRNSSYGWGGVGASTLPCSTTYRGASAASEPEVRAFQDYATILFPDQRGPLDTDPAPDDATGLFISLHSYSELVLFPWGWTSAAAPNMTALRTLGRKFGYHNRYQVLQSDGLYPTSGTSDDWTYGELGLASYTFELGTAFFQDCASFTNVIQPANLPALRYGFKAARRPYLAPGAPEVLHLTVTPAVTPIGGAVALAGVADDTRFFSGGHGVEPTHAVTAVRYSIGAPSWVEGVELLSATLTGSTTNPSVRTFAATLDTAGLAPGRHLVFVEAQDTTGRWGVPSAVFVQVGGPTIEIERTPAGCEVVRWPTVPNVKYDLEYSTNLLATPHAGFAVLADGLPASPNGVRAFTNCAPAAPAGFYRVRLRP